MNCILSVIFFISGCVHTDTVMNKSSLNGFDFRLFENTPAWTLARAVQDENINIIRTEIVSNKSLLIYREAKFGQAILVLAVKNQKYNSVETLLGLGADPNMQDRYDGSSPMMEAAKLNNELLGGPDDRYLKLMLKYRGDPNAEEKTSRRAENSSRCTPLLNACSRGVFNYVKILVEAGANVNYTNEFGGNALYSAIVAKNPDIVMYLLEKGADFTRPMAQYPAFDLGGVHEKSKKLYISDALKAWRFPVGSAKYVKRMEVINFLKRNGIDYH